MTPPVEPPPAPGRWRQLSFLAVAELLAMSLWFSASAVVPQLTAEWSLSPAQQSGLTLSVQLGFVCGALLSALFNLPDRVSSPRLFALSALGAAAANAMIPLWGGGGPEVYALRFLTGAALAGVYPPAMKIVATWFRQGRGLGIGLLVGALTLGSGLPHLINAVPLFGAGGMPPWRAVLHTSSALAALAAALAALCVRAGPFLAGSAPFDWRFAARALTHRPTRLANFGYLGHMWELYAVWTWVPLFLLHSYRQAGWPLEAARLAGFGLLAAGAVGCVLAGRAADRLGRTAVTSASLALSGACCLVAGPLQAHPAALTLLCLVWGFAVVADSAQFSVAVSELTDPRYVGSALTLQTSMGFLLTLATIHGLPVAVARFGWDWVFLLLVPGPAFGLWSMLSLRRLPEAAQMAGGRR